jgi:cytochrome c556
MMAISTNAPLLRGTDTDVAKAKEQIAALKKAFTDAEAFFKSQSAPDAVDWAGQALKSVAAMEAATAAATPKWEDVRTAATTVGGLCGPCHAARRERLEDGSYRFKK